MKIYKRYILKNKRENIYLTLTDYNKFKNDILNAKILATKVEIKALEQKQN